jgi:hypothetical protein
MINGKDNQVDSIGSKSSKLFQEVDYRWVVSGGACGRLGEVGKCGCWIF